MAAKRTGKRHRYLLGDSVTEAARLRAQARLWDPVAEALFDRVRVRRGWRVLEVGPGQGSLHLALRRRVRAPVDAVEHSHAFASHLRSICRRDRLGDGRIWESELLHAPLPAEEYVFIFARWVFLFLPNPAAHVRKLVRALRPGGILAIEDYYRKTLSMVPEPPEWAHFVAADDAFFASVGADASIGGLLPDIFRACGLHLVEVTPTVKTGHPGSPEWNWMTTYFLGVMERYARFPPLTRGEGRRLAARWRRAEHDPTSLLIAPAVLDVVGRKRSK
jgi:SAM-dependent methyltransferase